MNNEFEIKNAMIKSTSLSSDDHGVLSSWLHLDYGGVYQGFGGYALYLPKDFKHHKIVSAAGHFIWRVMEIASVTEWSKLPGRTLRVKLNRGHIHSIGHILNDDWFSPDDDFKDLS